MESSKIHSVAAKALACALVFAACGGTPPAPTMPGEAPPPMDIAEPEPTSGVLDTGGPVSEVEAPGELVMHFRWANPADTAAHIGAFANMTPAQAQGLLSQVARSFVADDLSGKVDPEIFGDLVQLDAPLEAVVVADMSKEGVAPEPIFAISIPLTSVQGALNASKGAPRPIGERVWELGTQDKWGDACAVSAAMGKAPARLVCTERKINLEKVAAFVARNVAKKPDSADDMRLELSFRGLLDKYGRQWANQVKGIPVIVGEERIGNPTFDQALMEAADAVADEVGALIYDADAIAIDLGLDPAKGAHLSFEFQLAGQRSWLAQGVVEMAGSMGPTPDIAWLAPASSHAVVWGKSADSARFQKMFDIGRRMATGLMEKEGVGSAADRQALAKLLRLVQRNKQVPAVMATGHFPRPRSGPPKGLLDMVDDSVGWYLMGFDESPGETKKWLQEAVRAYNRPGVQKVLKDELGPRDAKILPKVKAVSAAGLGGGALALEMTVPQVDDPFDRPLDASKQKTVDLKGYLVLVGDKTRSWLGIAANKKELTKLMVGLKAQSAPLSSLPGLDRMKSESHAGGVVTSMKGLVGFARPFALWLMTSPRSYPRASNEIDKVLAGLPNKGDTPIFMFVDAMAGARPSMKMSLDMPTGAIEDAASAVVKALQ